MVSPALQFTLLKVQGRARRTRMILPHKTCEMPMFMPVGTQGSVKGITVRQMEAEKIQLILGNTFHLALRPNAELLDEFGGLHGFANWNNALLTDSGGFQMVSLLDLAEITEEGVKFQYVSSFFVFYCTLFLCLWDCECTVLDTIRLMARCRSPHDGQSILLTPEESIITQNKIGADIIMALDDVVSSTTTGPRVEEAMHRTLRWIDRCISAHQRPHEQNLFGIVQGGLNEDLRRRCARELVARDLPGYAIGGLSGGEAKDAFWRMVKVSCEELPADKPRYLMGVGHPLDIMVAVALGVDTFDCVLPTRTARFGTAWTMQGPLSLRGKSHAADFRRLEEDCHCATCSAGLSRARLAAGVRMRDSAMAAALSLHNLSFMQRMMATLRGSIEDGTFERTVVQNIVAWCEGQVPAWAVEALASVQITIPDENHAKRQRLS